MCNNTNAGTGVVLVQGKGAYEGAVAQTFTIAKADNPMKVVAKKPTVNYSKKAQTVKQAAAYSFKKTPVGTVTFARVAEGSAAELPKVDKKSGDITVKAKAAKGKTYKVNVKVKAAGDANYKSANTTVTVKVKVK